MKIKQINQIISVLADLAVILLVICLLCALVFGVTKLVLRDPAKAPSDTETDSSQQETDAGATPKDVLLHEGADGGMAYIDQMIFFGESTTAHLRSRGVLSGGTDTTQVWADASGTKMLSSRITSQPFPYPPTGEALTPAQACALAKPKYLVLSFGLNGITDFVQNKDSYVSNYAKLITAVQKASPDTKIILQTVYPVRSATGYSVDTDTLNGYINTVNEWIPEIAAMHENVRVADTASVLKDASGRLQAAYDNGDGIHLTKSAYEQILQYLRTHPWED